MSKRISIAIIAGLLVIVSAYVFATQISGVFHAKKYAVSQVGATSTLGDALSVQAYESASTSSDESGALASSAIMSSNGEHALAQKISAMAATSASATVLLADGCFWSTQRDLEEVKGVISTVAGYAGGTTPNPNYENYVAGGYREAVLVTYNPQIVSYANLVEHIIKHGDPTDSTGSFYDRGPEYIPAIYYSNQEERQEAHAVIAAVDALKVFKNPLPLLVIPRGTFYPAEDYHQDFAKKNPIRYNAYRLATTRDAFIEKHWGSAADTFTVTAAPSPT